MGEPFELRGWLGFSDRQRQREVEQTLLDELGVSFEPFEDDHLAPEPDGNVWRWNVSADVGWTAIEKTSDAMRLLSDQACVGEARLRVGDRPPTVFVATADRAGLQKRLGGITAWLIQELEQVGIDAAPELDPAPRTGLGRWFDRGSPRRRADALKRLWEHTRSFELSGEPLSAWRAPFGPMLSRVSKTSARPLRLFRAGAVALEGAGALMDALSDGDPRLGGIAADLYRNLGETCDTALGVVQLFFAVEAIRGRDLESIPPGAHRAAQDELQRWREALGLE